MALLEAAGGSPGPQGRVLLPAAVVAAALESCRGEYALLARDPGRDLAIGPAPGRIHVHNMGEAPAVGDPRTGRTPARDLPRSGVRRPGHASPALPGLHQQPCHSRRRAGGAASAVFVPRHRRRDGQAHRRPRPGPRLADAGALRDGERRAVGPGEDSPGWRHRPRHGLLVSPLRLGVGVCDGIITAARLGMAVQVLTNPVAGTTAPASLAGALAQQDAENPRRRGAGAGRRTRYRVRLRRAALPAPPRDGRLLCGAGQWSLASVGATLLARRHGLACDCYGPGHVGAPRRRAGRVPAGPAGTRRRARAPGA